MKKVGNLVQRNHGRNFVVKCGGTGWCKTNILWNVKRKCGGHGILYPHCLKKWGGGVPGFPHLIAPMNETNHNAMQNTPPKQEKNTTIRDGFRERGALGHLAFWGPTQVWPIWPFVWKAWKYARFICGSSSKTYLLLCRLWFYNCVRSSTEIKAFRSSF